MAISRKEFFKRTCGFCGCAGALLLPGPDAVASQPTRTDACKPLEDKLKLTAAWLKDLTEAMDAELDEATRKKILERCGRACAHRFAEQMMKKHRGDLDGWLAAVRKMWAESAEHDKAKGVVRLRTKKMDQCLCPMAHYSTGMPSRTFCYCSLGHMKEIFGAVTGKAVDVTLEETVLTGGQRCSFVVQL